MICLGEAFGSVSLPRTPKDRTIVETSGPVSSRNLSLGSSHYPGFHRQEVVGKGFSSLRRRQKAAGSWLVSAAVWVICCLVAPSSLSLSRSSDVSLWGTHGHFCQASVSAVCVLQLLGVLYVEGKSQKRLSFLLPSESSRLSPGWGP